jgi:acyl-CoA synthetase (AMP-forming)/AMP-acid ligase II
VTYLPPEMLDSRPTSVGRGMPNVEVWLTDERGSRLPFGSTGELVVRGQNVMRGYWNKPEASGQRLRKDRVSGDMILYTGDIFRTDGEGWLYFVGRTDDIIKSRGEKVSPREVENAIHYLEGIADVAVVGVPDEVLGEAIKAFVVLREGVELTEREVILHCRALLEGHLVPKHVSFVAVLPTTDTGKISKRMLG